MNKVNKFNIDSKMTETTDKGGYFLVKFKQNNIFYDLRIYKQKIGALQQKKLIDIFDSKYDQYIGF